MAELRVIMLKWERLAAVRTLILVVIGLSALVTAAWVIALPAGLAALGVAVLLLAYLTDPNGPNSGGRPA